MKINLDERDLQLINQVYTDKVLTEQDILLMPDKEIIELTYLLGGLIGYDKEIDDIDAVGKMADDTISKLLVILEKRWKATSKT